MPNLTNRPKARAGVETYIVPDGTCFLYDPTTDASYVLDQVGALVWDFCDGKTLVTTMIAEVSELAPTDDGVAARVTGLVADFASEGLLDTAEVARDELSSRGAEATANDA